MAYKIDATFCTGCSACEPECPNQAIHEKSGMFYIEQEKCTECIGHFDEAQCVAACPVDDTVIIDDRYPRYAAA